MTLEEAIEVIKYLNDKRFGGQSESLKMAIQALKQEPKWIPVSERLPEEGGDYLVTLCFDICCTGTVREVRKNFFCILSKKWLYEDEDVIAWMPLPEPYKTESEE